MADDMMTFVLQGAVMLEMARVTEASMETVLADRDAWIRCCHQIDALSTKRDTLQREAYPEDRTDDQTAEIDRLSAQIESLRERADATDIGLISARSDAMMFGSAGGPKVFAALARSIAHMAQVPGGVEMFGLHWCRGHSGGVTMRAGELCNLDIAEAY